MEDGSIVNQIPVDFCRSQHHIGTGVPVKGKGAVSLAVKLYEEGYTAGYEAGYHDGEEQATGNEKHFAQFSGSFTATVEQILPDYYALPGKTVAVVHFFQDRPFLLHFQKDLTGELIEGTAYVFEFETFEVELPDDEENPNISDYMYSINVTNYRVAEDDELGLEGKMPTVEIVSK